MKRILIAVLVLGLIGVAVFATLRGSRKEKGTQIYVETVARRDIGRVVKASGEIDPKERVNISAHVIGKIERLYVEEGDLIERGKPFLELEKEAFSAARDQWQANLRRAQTDVRQAEVGLADARHKLTRARRLSQEGIVSAEQLESAELAEANAALRLEDARQSVQQAEAQLEKARDDLTKTTIYSPIRGRVIKLNAEEGEVVVSGTMNNPASVIGEIADLSVILANVDVDETEVVLVKPGQRATIRVDALPNKEYHGRVAEVGSKGFSRPQQPDVTFFDVEILLDDPDEDLRPGMSVRAEIDTAVHPNALVVPIQAVVEREKEDGEAGQSEDTQEINVVFVAENGKAVQRPVRTGISDETRVEIVSGLKEGDKVVTGPYRSLRDLEDGEAVRITDPRKDRKKDKGRRNKDAEDEEDRENR